MKIYCKSKIFIILLFLLSCSSKSEKDRVLEKEGEVSMQKRQEAFVKNQGGLFGIFDPNKKDGEKVSFSTSNVLWRATLKTLDFIPLSSIDYTGGLIVTDWYSDKDNPMEQIKIQIKFLSNEVRSESVEVTSFKKKCSPNGLCGNSSMNENFNSEIKSSILNLARSIRIQEEKKKN